MFQVNLVMTKLTNLGNRETRNNHISIGIVPIIYGPHKSHVNNKAYKARYFYYANFQTAYDMATTIEQYKEKLLRF